eukprot:6193584-Pleurochrysis_carterae.AAC.3
MSAMIPTSSYALKMSRGSHSRWVRRCNRYLTSLRQASLNRTFPDDNLRRCSQSGCEGEVNSEATSVTCAHWLSASAAQRLNSASGSTSFKNALPKSCRGLYWLIRVV